MWLERKKKSFFRLIIITQVTLCSLVRSTWMVYTQKKKKRFVNYKFVSVSLILICLKKQLIRVPKGTSTRETNGPINIEHTCDASNDENSTAGVRMKTNGSHKHQQEEDSFIFIICHTITQQMKPTHWYFFFWV